MQKELITAAVEVSLKNFSDLLPLTNCHEIKAAKISYTLYSNSPSGVAIKTKDGKIVSLNTISKKIKSGLNEFFSVFWNIY